MSRGTAKRPCPRRGDIERYRGGIAPDVGVPSEAARLLLKAVRGLPEGEQAVVLAYLVERALALPGEEAPTDPARLARQMPVPTAVVEGLGSIAGDMLYRDGGVDDLASLYAITREAVCDTLREVASEREAPEPQAGFLRLLAEGRTASEARTELDISERELEQMRERPNTRKLELRLGRALLTKSYHRDQASAVIRTLKKGVPPVFGPPAGVVGALGSGPQQVVPVRFPVEQYERLKDWCSDHGFPMAVVVRGLVERFLDEQERRAD